MYETAGNPKFWRDKLVRRNILLCMLWGAILLCLYAFRGIILPFIGALLLAYVIEPVIRGVCSLKVGRFQAPRWAAVIVLYLAAFGLITVLLVSVVPRIYREVQRAAESTHKTLVQLDDATIERQAHRLERWLLPSLPQSDDSDVLSTDQASSDDKPVVDLAYVAKSALQRLKDQVRDGMGQLVGKVQGVVLAIADATFGVFLLLMLTAFISIDAGAIRRFFMTMVPNSYYSEAESLLDRIDIGLAGVVRGQLNIMLINGALTFIGLWIFGVKFALFLALVATVFYVVPIFGTIFSSVPIVAVALADSASKAFAILLWIIGIHALEAYYLNPKILGGASKIHPVLIVFALLAGEHVGGIIGALLAVPAMSVALAIFRSAHRHVNETNVA